MSKDRTSEANLELAIRRQARKITKAKQALKNDEEKLLKLNARLRNLKNRILATEMTAEQQAKINESMAKDFARRKNAKN